MENRRFVVAGVALADIGQRSLVILRPGGVVDRLPVLVEHREGIDVVALAVGLRVGAMARSRAAAPCFSSSGRRRRPYRVIPGPRDAPISHGAGRVGLGGIVERDARLLVAERMEQRRSAGNQLCAGALQEVRQCNHNGERRVTAPAELPLAGIKIVDFTQVMMGPVATQVLADFGADVIKVERPPTGDLSRTSFPNDPAGLTGPVYCSLNRNKRSIVLDLRKQEDKDAVLQLLDQADVVVNNFRAPASWTGWVSAMRN